MRYSGSLSKDWKSGNRIQETDAGVVYIEFLDAPLGSEASLVRFEQSVFGIDTDRFNSRMEIKI